jgi:hypothetical protein
MRRHYAGRSDSSASNEGQRMNALNNNPATLNPP